MKWVEEVALKHDGEDCLLFPFGRNASGYARLRVGDRHPYGHSFVCERVRGPRPTPRHQAAHSCGNGHLGCLAPKHLSWKTAAENAKDKILHGTVARAPKLEPSGARFIRDALASAMRYRDIARMFGVRGDAIAEVARGKTWSRLDEQGDDAGEAST